MESINDDAVRVQERPRVVKNGTCCIIDNLYSWDLDVGVLRPNGTRLKLCDPCLPGFCRR